MSDVSWRQIDRITYLAIYVQFDGVAENDGDGGWRVFGTCTEIGEVGETGRRDYIYTEWGLLGADYPLIRSIRRGDSWTYWIAVISNDEEGSDDE